MVPRTDDNGWLRRGWRPGRRFLATVLFVGGVLLIAHPLIGGIPNAFDLKTAEYNAIEIQPDGESLEFGYVGTEEYEARQAVYDVHGFDSIDCYPGSSSRECKLERTLIGRQEPVGGAPIAWSGYSYHDGFYERVGQDTENETGWGLRPVTARAALSNVSVPEADWSAPVRDAVETGSVTVNPPLSLAGSVLERDGSFYVVVPRYGSEPKPDTPPGRYETAVSVLLGAFSIQGSLRLRERSLL